MQPDPDDMLGDVLHGLSRTPRRLSPKYFYDARGSRLFERICEQPEYYLTRAELALMETHLPAIADTLGPRCLLVEYGSGSGIKTRLLLRHLHDPVAYMPLEISRARLQASVEPAGGRLPGHRDAAGVRGLHAAGGPAQPVDASSGAR